jgi:N-hydroxyarylamine O-acetyltransferase
MDIDAYLKRIGVSGRKKPDLEFLTELQRRHLLSIPFENLDIVPLGKPFGIDTNKFFEKLVLKNRGGFCYENNTVFGMALSELGFDVTYLSAGVMNEKNEFGPEFDHMTLLVRLEKDYLADVGFGDSSHSPLAFDEEPRTDLSGAFRIHRNDDSTFFLEKNVEGQWKPEHRFTLIPHTFSEYEMMCRYHQTSADSPFTRKSLCTIATEHGRFRLSDMNFAITHDGEKTERTLSSQEEWKDVLKTHFGIVL